MANRQRKEICGQTAERIIMIIFTIIAAAFVFIYIFIKETDHKFAYVEGTPYVPETQVIVKEIVPDNMIVNINTASIEELMTLDGIGEVTAQKIIEYRENNNGFLTVDELTKVDGIGEAKLDKIRSFVTVE